MWFSASVTFTVCEEVGVTPDPSGSTNRKKGPSVSGLREVPPIKTNKRGVPFVSTSRVHKVWEKSSE